MPEIDFERPAFWPTDERLARAIARKRDEYLGRVATKFGPYMHPEAAAVMGIMQGDNEGLDMLARTDFMRELQDQGPAGLHLIDFAEQFAVKRPNLAPHTDSEKDRRRYLVHIMEQVSIVRAYCEGDLESLTNSTGLQFDDEPTEVTPEA